MIASTDRPSAGVNPCHRVSCGSWAPEGNSPAYAISRGVRKPPAKPPTSDKPASSTGAATKPARGGLTVGAVTERTPNAPQRKRAV